MTSEPDAPARVTTQQLVALVLDPRDPGYEAAAARRAGRPPRRRSSALTAIGALAVGFVLALGWVQTHRSAPEEAKVHDALVSRVRSAQVGDTALADTVTRLSNRLSQLRAAALSNSSRLLAGLDQSALLAGQVAAVGPGVQVTLSEPEITATPTSVPGKGERTPITTGHILVDQDIRRVVNELWADGAEAIAVNGIRLTPTSAIRFAGDAVLVDFEPIASPYDIDAIGNPNQLITRFASSAVASRYQTLAAARGIGFSIDNEDRLELPAASVAQLRYARRGTLPGQPATGRAR